MSPGSALTLSARTTVCGNGSPSITARRKARRVIRVSPVRLSYSRLSSYVSMKASRRFTSSRFTLSPMP